MSDWTLEALQSDIALRLGRCTLDELEAIDLMLAELEDRRRRQSGEDINRALRELRDAEAEVPRRLFEVFAGGLQP